MYDVGGDETVERQIEALPATMLDAFAELRAALEVAPWAGDPINAFGPGGVGLVVNLVLDDQRRVEILQVTSLG